MTFQFIPGPTGQGLSDQDFLASALDQPLSLTSTAWGAVKGGVLDSFYLGTELRDTALPQEPQTTQESVMQTAEGLLPLRLFSAIRGAKALTQEPSPLLSEDDYKASPSFREGVPWDKGMTQARAAALADAFDAKQVREFYSRKRPITAFFGNLAGQAIDPINYIPIAGEVVGAANVAKFGRVAGTALTASADAMANTALASIGSAPVRESFGDDVSWQSTVSQIAMAGLIGAAFGGISGAIGRRTDAKALAEATDSLSTLENVHKSRVALNDAIDGVVRDGEVRLSETSAGYVDDAISAVNRDAAIAPHNPWEQFETYSPRDISDATVPETVFHGTSHGNFDQFDPYSGEYGLMGAGSYFTENPRIAAEYTTKGKGGEPAVYEARIKAENPLDMEAKADVEAWRNAFDEYLPNEDFDGNPIDYSGKTNEQMYRAVEETLSQEMIPSYEGAEVMQDGLRAMGHDSVTHIGGGRHKDSKGVKHRVWIVFDPEQATITNRHHPAEAPALDAKPEMPLKIPAMRQPFETETEFGKFATGKEVTFQFARNPNMNSEQFAPDAFGRDIEPAGRYLVDVTEGRAPDGWESGEISFKSPLVLQWDDGGWKKVLQNRYRATGKKLSQKIVDDGYDGIVTIDGKFGPSEIVDLKSFRPKKVKTKALAVSSPVIRGEKVGTDTTVGRAPLQQKGLTDAATQVGKPDNARAMSEQYRVNPDTGDFPEMGDIEQLRASGRLTPEDEAALSEAEDTFKQASGYGEALKAFSRCEI